MAKKEIYINEDKLDALSNQKHLLPKFLYSQLQKHQTSLGDNPAFPPEIDTPFDYLIIKRRYKEVVDEVIEVFGEEMLAIESATTAISSLLRRCKELERPIRPQLEKVAYNAINRLFAIPPDTINYDCKLVDKVTKHQNARITPEDNEKTSYQFTDIHDVLQSSKAIAKRRIINALIQGGAHALGRIEDLYADELNSLNEELLPLYKQIMVLSEYLLFIKKEKMNDKTPPQGAFVCVKMGNIDKRTEIQSEGIIFPLMFNELIRGFLEQFSSYGLPKDYVKASFILKKADFMLAEPWDMRFGIGLWNKLMPHNIDTNAIPYYFKIICELSHDDFNHHLQNIFSNTEQGEKFKNDIVADIQHNADYTQFVNDLQAKNVDKSIINDGYFSAAELDDFFLDGDEEPTEEILTDEIDNESSENLVENDENEAFSTPDTSYINGEKVNWVDNDAIPFFILKNGKLEYGTPRDTHQHYYKDNYGQDNETLHGFINSIVLQGRYWKDKNVISFWYMGEEDNMSTLIRKAVKLVADLHRDCYIAYKDKLYQVMRDENDYMWFKDISEPEENTELTPEKEKKLQHWWESDMNFVKRTFVINDSIGGKFFTRPLNDYELFAANCHQIWADFIKNESFTYEEVELFVDLLTKGRLSFKEGLNYFARNLRNKIIGKQLLKQLPNGHPHQSESAIEDFLNDLGISRSEYTVIYHEDNGKPYSYNIHITDGEKMQYILQQAHANNIDISRVNKRRFDNEHFLYTARLRERFN